LWWNRGVAQKSDKTFTATYIIFVLHGSPSDGDDDRARPISGAQCNIEQPAGGHPHKVQS